MNEIVKPLSFALVHFLWQGAAIALALALALRLTRNANASLRYAWCVTALGLMLLMPVGTILYTIGSDAAAAKTQVASPVERSASVPVAASGGPAPGPARDGRIADRPYRAGQPIAIARQEIRKHRATQFDPRLVDIFLKTPESELESIRRAYPDSEPG